MSNITLLSQRAASFLFAACALFVGNGCERREGRYIDSTKTQLDDLEFLVVRNTVAWYDEFTVGFYCRSPGTITSARTQFLDSAEPSQHKGQGWRTFSGYSKNITDLKSDSPLGAIQIYDSNTAYLESGLTMTFDGCRTRVYFNVSEGARFVDSMSGTGIRYPQRSHHYGAPFLRNMKVHEGGGCFEINPEYVEERKQYFYCSSDLGKTWTLETERKQTPTTATEPALGNKPQIKKPN